MKTTSGIILPHRKSGTCGDEHEYEPRRPSGPGGPTLFIPKVPQDQESHEYSWDGYVSYLGSAPGNVFAKAFYEGSKKTAKNEGQASDVVKHQGVPMTLLDKLPVGKPGQILGPGGWKDPISPSSLPKPQAPVPWEPMYEFVQKFPAYQQLLQNQKVLDDYVTAVIQEDVKGPVEEKPPPEPAKDRLDCLEFV